MSHRVYPEARSRALKEAMEDLHCDFTLTTRPDIDPDLSFSFSAPRLLALEPLNEPAVEMDAPYESSYAEPEYQYADERGGVEPAQQEGTRELADASASQAGAVKDIVLLKMAPVRELMCSRPWSSTLLLVMLAGSTLIYLLVYSAVFVGADGLCMCTVERSPRLGVTAASTAAQILSMSTLASSLPVSARVSLCSSRCCCSMRRSGTFVVAAPGWAGCCRCLASAPSAASRLLAQCSRRRPTQRIRSRSFCLDSRCVRHGQSNPRTDSPLARVRPSEALDGHFCRRTGRVSV